MKFGIPPNDFAALLVAMLGVRVLPKPAAVGVVTVICLMIWYSL